MTCTSVKFNILRPGCVVSEGHPTVIYMATAIFSLQISLITDPGTTVGVGDFRVNPRFHPKSVGWNLCLTREFSTPTTVTVTVRHWS